jgi:Bacterial Ig-like domain
MVAFRSRVRSIRQQPAFDQLESRQLLALTMTPLVIAAAQGTTFNGVVAGLNELALHASPADFNTPPGSVEISWGDGQMSAGTVVGPVVAPGVFEVTGTHAYSQLGTYAVLVSVSDTSGDQASALSTATVAPQPFLIAVNSLSGAPGDSLPPQNQNLATFISPNAADNAPSDFSAVINWGDGQSTIGSVLGPYGGGQQTFIVSGSHMYSTAGMFPVSVAIAVLNGPTSTGIGQADITLAAPYPSTSAPVVVTASQFFTAALGTFTDLPSPTTLFSGVIEWGDGSTSPAVITNSNGNYTVYGTYTYSTPGTYPITVTISDPIGNTFTISDTAQVATINLSNSMLQLTGGLAPIPSNGPHVLKGYTNTNQPTFSGTTAPFATVQLYARPFGIDTQEPPGETVAGINGQWTLTVGPLLAGMYNFAAIVTPSAGIPSVLTPLSNNGLVHIDMVPEASKVKRREPRAVATHKLVGSRRLHHPHKARPEHLRV